MMASANAEILIRVHKTKALNSLDRIIRAIDELTPQAVEEVRDQTRRDIIRLLRMRWHPRNTPTPSPPGEPPARISSDLLRSLRPFPVERTDLYTWHASIKSFNDYSRIQELGGMSGRGHRTYLPPRPYLRRAVNDLRAVDYYKGVFITYWSEAMRAG